MIHLSTMKKTREALINSYSHQLTSVNRWELELISAALMYPEFYAKISAVVPQSSYPGAYLREDL